MWIYIFYAALILLETGSARAANSLDRKFDLPNSLPNVIPGCPTTQTTIQMIIRAVSKP